MPIKCEYYGYISRESFKFKFYTLFCLLYHTPVTYSTRNSSLLHYKYMYIQYTITKDVSPFPSVPIDLFLFFIYIFSRFFPLFLFFMRFIIHCVHPPHSLTNTLWLSCNRLTTIIIIIIIIIISFSIHGKIGMHRLNCSIRINSSAIDWYIHRCINSICVHCIWYSDRIKITYNRTITTSSTSSTA